MADSKGSVFVRSFVMWFFFAAFLILAIASMFISVLSGLIVLLGACVFVPKINHLIKAKTDVVITPGARVVAVLICLSFFFYTTNKAFDADRAERDAKAAVISQQKADLAQKEKREYVSANKEAVLAEMNGLITKGDYAGAIALGSKYNDAGSLEIDQALSKASLQKAEVEKQQKKSILLSSLNRIQQDDLKALAATYIRLAAIDQSYQANADKFSKLAEQKAQETKAREQAAAERASRKNMGLAWNYVDSEDSMSGKSVRRAYVSSINTVDFKFPYSGEQRATLTIRKHPRWGTSVYVVIDRGQFICGYDNCNVRVRFSTGDAQRMSASEPGDHSSNLLFVSNASSFIAQARKSDKVFIEASFYQEGNRIFEFDISDLEWK